MFGLGNGVKTVILSLLSPDLFKLSLKNDVKVVHLTALFYDILIPGKFNVFGIFKDTLK